MKKNKMYNKPWKKRRPKFNKPSSIPHIDNKELKQEKSLEEIIDDIYANEQQCQFCIFDDECPHGMRCYGGNPIEPACCNGYERCFDEDKYWEYIEEN